MRTVNNLTVNSSNNSHVISKKKVISGKLKNIARHSCYGEIQSPVLTIRKYFYYYFYEYWEFAKCIFNAHSL